MASKLTENAEAVPSINLVSVGHETAIAWLLPLAKARLLVAKEIPPIVSTLKKYTDMMLYNQAESATISTQPTFPGGDPLV